MDGRRQKVKKSSVKNKNIVITGSSGLLGSFYSEILLQSGANIALIDIDLLFEFKEWNMG